MVDTTAIAETDIQALLRPENVSHAKCNVPLMQVHLTSDSIQGCMALGFLSDQRQVPSLGDQVPIGKT